MTQRAQAVLAMAGMAVFVGCVGVPAARADSTTAPFDAFASANAVDLYASNESLPLGLVAEGGGPESDVHMTSLGEADANASYPYVGSAIPGLPGLASGLYGVPLPNYPLTVTSQAGDAPKDANYPGITLHAESGAFTTLGQATAGTGGSGGTSLARVDVDQYGDVTAQTDSALNALKLGPLVSVTGLHSTVKVVADGTSGQLTKTSSLTIGQISVPGLSLTLPKTTPATIPLLNPIPGLPQPPPLLLPAIPIPLGGQTIATPDIGFEDGYFTITLPFLGSTQKFVLPAQTVLDAFKALGVDLSYQQAVQGSTAISGASFLVSYTVPSLPSNPYFNGPVPVTFTLGGATAAVTINPINALASAISGGSPAVTSGAPSSSRATSSSTSDTTGTTAGSPGGAGDGLGVTSGLGTPDTGGAPTLGSGDQSAPVVAGGPGPTLAAAAARGRTANAEDIYVVFVAIAVLAFVSVTVLRLRGVRLLWSS
jgi:hypothetical protein